MGPIYKQLSDTQCLQILAISVLFSTTTCTVRGAFASSLCKFVTFCRWLIKENRVFWLKLGVLRIRYLTRAVVLGIRYLKLSAPEPMLAGTRLFKRVEPRFWLSGRFRYNCPSRISKYLQCWLPIFMLTLRAADVLFTTVGFFVINGYLLIAWAIYFHSFVSSPVRPS